ncbi:MAG: hypothetical protein JNK02_03720 [Planctomycetes bacterium]|nr:hypothetical protein [Planctomycetota bacterium]
MPISTRSSPFRIPATLATAIAACVLASSARAEGGFVSTWTSLHPGSASASNVQAGTGTACQLCHWNVGGGPFWNAYGWRIRQGLNAGQSLTVAIQNAANPNSDGDPTGATNLAEILASTQPGWTPGPNNTRYQTSGTTTGQLPPAAIQGSLDPVDPSFAFCFGDGSGAACPCGNTSAASARAGCANSLGAGGVLVATGTASVSADSLVLAGAAMPNSSALYFQGTAASAAGAGVAFGDGLRCAAGAVIRLGTKQNIGGGSQYPAAGDPPVSVRGVNAPGDVRTYQVWYRNAAAYCTASTFNLTNGWQLTWGA